MSLPRLWLAVCGKDGVEYRKFKPVKAKLDEDWTVEENIEDVMSND